jgi:hypothetical protein
VVIIDHRKKGGFSFISLFKHYTPEEDIINALAKSGYKLSDKHDFLPAQSFLVFEISE